MYVYIGGLLEEGDANSLLMPVVYLKDYLRIRKITGIKNDKFLSTFALEFNALVLLFKHHLI